MKAKNMLGNQSGFTLIEIVAVLIIIGILAAVAVPKYFDLTEEANESAVKAQAANLTAGSAMNFAKYKLDGTSGSYTTVNACADATKVVESFDEPKFSIGGSGSPSATFTLMLTTATGDAATICEVSAD